jgi:hypothetical protein
MYWKDNKRHKMPHIHAMFNNQAAVFDFNGNCLAGDIGHRASRLVKEFVKARRGDLEVAWKCALAGEEIQWVKPIS